MRWGVASVLLKNHANVDARDPQNSTALHHAAMKNNIALIRFLITYKANVNATNILRQTPLIIASEYGKHAAVNELLKHSPDVQISDISNKTAMQCAVAQGYEGVLQEFLAFDIGITVISISKMKCSKSEDKILCCDIIKHNLSDSCHNFFCDDNGFSVLYNCVKFGHMEAFEYALDTCDAEDCNIGEPTPTWMLASTGESQVLRKMLLRFQHKIDVTKTAADGTTPLIQAIGKNYFDVVRTFADTSTIPIETICNTLAKFGKHDVLVEFLSQFPEQQSSQLLINAIKSESLETLKVVTKTFNDAIACLTDMQQSDIKILLKKQNSIEICNFLLSLNFHEDILQVIPNKPKSSLLVEMSHIFNVFNPNCEDSWNGDMTGMK